MNRLFFLPYSFYYCLFVFLSPTYAKNTAYEPINYPSKTKFTTSCSQQSWENLTTQLMLDLPSYANRVTQRSRRLGLGVDLYPYVMVAGRSEFKSLPLNPNINTDSSYVSKGVEQLFFTTLERQYSKEKSIELQQFHWLFVTKTPSGWRLVMMFSQAGEYPLKSVISPPRNSSNGVIAQAVKLWLRDCQAASLRS